MPRSLSVRALSAFFALALGLLVGLPAGASAAASSPFPHCSWWTKTTPETLNVAFPDAAATYWTTPFYAEAGTEIEIEGQYPNARYMSFNVYDENGGSFEANGVSSGIADYQIEPQAGSVNPFQRLGRPGGAFTLALSADAEPGERNVLPLAPEEAMAQSAAPLGFLLYRVYLPTGGNGAVQLPKISLVRNGERMALPRCPVPTGKLAASVRSKASATKAAQGIAARLRVQPTKRMVHGLLKLGKALRGGSEGAKPCRRSACPPPLRFFRASAAATNSFFPNVNNAYVSALFRPVPGTVVVVRGKAPTTPRGTHPVPWPQKNLQLRYFSLCNNVYRSPWPVVANPIGDGKSEYGCAADFETSLNAAGEYAYVVAEPSKREAIEAAGGTFIPLSTTQPHARQILILRNMLPNESFDHAVQNAPQNAKPAGAAKAMGRYYPRAYRCTLAQFEAGDRACG